MSTSLGTNSARAAYEVRLKGIFLLTHPALGSRNIFLDSLAPAAAHLLTEQKDMIHFWVLPWDWGVEDYLRYYLYTIKNIAHSFWVRQPIDSAEKDFVPLSWAEVEVYKTYICVQSS